MAWRWAVASVRGVSHIRSGDRLQDAYAVSAFGEDNIFAIVSDGAGSAKFSAYGAWIVCRVLKVQFRDWLVKNEGLPSDQIITNWIYNLKDRISVIAQKRGIAEGQFAATLAALLISPRETVAIHIGDSAIVGRHGSEWQVICWPENGEYASSTYFFTDNPKPRLNIIRQNRQYNAFALFTDGVGDLALLHMEQQAHQRFFNPMMRPVDDSPGAGRLPKLSKKLQSFLAGSSVCEFTHDDKTLILLSGVCPCKI